MSNIPFNYYGVPAEVTPSGIRMMIFPNTTQYDVVILRATGTLEPSQSSFVEIARIPNTQLSEQGTIFEDILPVDGIQRWYDFYQTAEGFATSSWFSGSIVAGTFQAVASTPMQGTYTQNPVNTKPIAVYAASTIDAEGSQLTNAVTQINGAGSSGLVIVKGQQSGQISHGGTYTFNPVFDHAPMIQFGAGGIQYQPAKVWSANKNLSSATGSANTGSAQYNLFTAQNVASSSFTASLLLTQKGTPSIVSNSFQTNTMTAVNNAVTASLTHAPASDDTYTLNYRVYLEADGNDFANVSATAVIVAESFDGSSWTQNSQKTYNVSGVTTANNTWPAETQVISVSGLTSSDAVRLRVSSLTGTGAGVTEVLQATGSIVTYNNGGGNQYTSATPANGDVVSWFAFSVT